MTRKTCLNIDLARLGERAGTEFARSSMSMVLYRPGTLCMTSILLARSRVDVWDGQGGLAR